MIGVQIKGRQHVSVWDLTSWRTSKIPRAMWVWPTLSCKSSLPPHVNPRKIPSRFWRLMASLLLCSSAGPAQSGILTDREVVSLFLHFTVNPKPRVEFIDRPRCCLRGKECSISRFQQVESRWGYSGTSDRIRSASLLILLLIDSCLLSFEPTLDLNPQGYMLDPGLHHINPSVNPEGESVLLSKSIAWCINLHVQLQAATLLLYWQRFPANVAFQHRPLGGLFLWFSSGFLQLYGHVAVGVTRQLMASSCAWVCWLTSAPSGWFPALF